MAVSERTTPAEPYERAEDRVQACLSMICDGVTAARGDLQTLTDAIVQKIEDDQPAALGDAYRCFLKGAGGGAGRFLQGSDVFYPDVIGTREAAQALLAANGLALEDTDRVILMHQGSQFDFTRGPGVDPEVWTYTDGDDAPSQTAPRFTDWLKANAEEQTQAWAQLASWQALTATVKNRA